MDKTLAETLTGLVSAPSMPPLGGPLRSASPQSIENLSRQFTRQHYVALPGFFGRELIDTIAAQMALAEFETRTAGRIGSAWVMKPNALSGRLNWHLNETELLEIVRQVSGCADIGFFSGRIFRLDPAPGGLDWHDDRRTRERRVAISVNLGTRPHSGGALRIREKRARETVAEVQNRGAGDAVLFRVADHGEHCVTPVEGTLPRFAFSGWFASGPSYYAALLRTRGQPGAKPGQSASRTTRLVG